MRTPLFLVYFLLSGSTSFFFVVESSGTFESPVDFDIITDSSNRYHGREDSIDQLSESYETVDDHDSDDFPFYDTDDDGTDEASCLEVLGYSIHHRMNAEFCPGAFPQYNDEGDLYCYNWAVANALARPELYSCVIITAWGATCAIRCDEETGCDYCEFEVPDSMCHRHNHHSSVQFCDCDDL